MRLAGFVLLKHWSSSGALLHGPAKIREGLGGRGEREVRYATEELVLNGFLVKRWDDEHRREAWFPAFPTRKAEKKTGTTCSADRNNLFLISRYYLGEELITDPTG